MNWIPWSVTERGMWEMKPGRMLKGSFGVNVCVGVWGQMWSTPQTETCFLLEESLGLSGSPNGFRAPLLCVWVCVCVDTLRWLVRKGLIFILGNNSLCGQKKEFKVHGIFVTSFCNFLLRCFSNFKMMEYSLHYLCFFQPIETTSQLFPLLASYKLRLYHFPERPWFGVVIVLMWWIRKL